MSDCLITSRGATRAHAMAGALASAGLPARVVRPPSEVSQEGCGYAVALARQLVPQAIEVLRAARLMPRRVYCAGVSGRYEAKECGL